MNYILKRIEKKVYINKNFKLLYLFINKNLFLLIISINNKNIEVNFKNILFLKKYLIESGILK